MKLLYLGYFSSPGVFQKLENAGLDPSTARQNYELGFLHSIIEEELLKKEDLTIVSYLPRNDKLEDCKAKDEFLGIELNYVWTSRSNCFEMLCAIFRMSTQIRIWMKETNGEPRAILTYAANPILLIPAFLFKGKTKIVTVVSEVPQYRNMTEGNPVVNLIKKKVFSFFNNRMDGYIYMTRHMDEVCNPRKKPWIVVEGMTQIPERMIRDEKHTQPVILYAGGLHIENGIDVLLEAFERMQNKNAVLQLCGIGNATDRIVQYAAKNERIQYLGTLPNERVRKLEREATLLVNPRKPDSMLTRYSFPSKTFEYFSSGTPCALSKLEGIPEEFYEYCYVCDVSNADRLASDLDSILTKSQDEREIKGVQVYEFLKKEKSAKIQTKKIIDFMNELV